MKKTFNLTHPKLQVSRVIEAIKYEVKKYLKRERNKTLPEGVDFWDFDCRFGDDEATSTTNRKSVTLFYTTMILP